MSDLGLVSLLASSLDPHLLLLLLEHQLKVVPGSDPRPKLELLARTRMVDHARDEYEKAGLPVPAHLAERRTTLLAEGKALAARTADLRKQLEEGGKPARSEEGAAALAAWARFQYDAGNYGAASEGLAQARSLGASEEGVAWGQAACAVLLGEWAAGEEALGRVREAAEKTEHAALQLTQRAWLLHWALFVCFGQGEAGAGKYLDLALTEVHLNAVQTTAPHLLRYIAVAHVAANGGARRSPLSTVVRVVEQEAAAYSDPVTRFLHALYVEYNFEAALTELKAAEESLKNDYFLAKLAPQFVENARVLVFRSYCKIHQSIDLAQLSAKLGLAKPSDAESYIVNLIRNEQDAKIDSASNQIVFQPTSSSIYQKIVEKTQALSTQTALLQAQLQRSKR